MTTPAISTAPPHRGVTARLLRNPLGAAALVLLIAVIAISLLAPLLAPYDPNTVIPGIARSAPGAGHLLGGDGAGRDVLSRLLHGGRQTLLGALVTTVVAMLVGIPSGLVAGYFGNAFDTAANWVSNMIIAMPGMVILLAAIAAIGPNTVAIMAVFGVLISPSFFRLVRTAVRNVRGELYIDAARISGLSDGRIIARHVLLVVRAPVIIQAAICAGIAVLMQTGIQFLGLGEQDVPSWGQMLSDAFYNIYSAPYLVIWPGLVIGVTVTALALLGNGLRDAVQDRPKLGRIAAAPEPTGTTTEDSGRLLEVGDLSIAYGAKIVVHGVSLGVAKGEVLGLVGESGSGKTQTAFAVLGLLPLEGTVLAGTIRFDGTDLSTLDNRERARFRGRRIAYVPQEPMSNLDPAFTVGAQLVEPMMAILRIPRAEARRRALELLARVGITDPAGTFAKYPHEISGGMAQRVLIAGAVSCDPDLLIADEPTTALDVTVQAEVLDLLRDLQRERNMAMLLVTHNFGVVADICDRVAVMREGRIVEQQDVASIFTAPEHPYTRSLLEANVEDMPARAPLAAGAGGRSQL
ncbi:dipeptide/oligopeptide/nickel ABC transporter permease/ATP-binding protein [Saccharopolyspora sp. K220]|uniref:dipeptide/oligopeptide/nickel ABC transporter permease/ATP-binding protein n=1 Tax=Saccharopolyspora soli TaxID=2926618 RepID=UPI001F57E27B|nr:dipeptide/oligopeptide/nickel ABC transporter permease/ATP-binding protein [Saccharopolyspora soli]MCI2417496.1 dipeptide/oligopeptide/nickel ABC transporter permease/ATP-binding protein [Saccharopolyspora soli]